MKERVFEQRTCPKCGRTYTERPALSRYDNNTLICPDCGTREELADIVSVLYERATEALTAAEKGSVPVRSPELSKLSKTKLYRLCEVLNSFLLLDGANINVKLTQAQLSARIFEAVE